MRKEFLWNELERLKIYFSRKIKKRNDTLLLYSEHEHIVAWNMGYLHLCNTYLSRITNFFGEYITERLSSLYKFKKLWINRMKTQKDLQRWDYQGRKQFYEDLIEFIEKYLS